MPSPIYIHKEHIMASPFAGQTLKVSSASAVIPIKVYRTAYERIAEQAKIERRSVARHMVAMIAEYLCCDIVPEDPNRSRNRKVVKSDDRGYFLVALRVPVAVRAFLEKLAAANQSSLTKLVIKVLAKKHGVPIEDFTMPASARKPAGRPRCFCPHCGKFYEKPLSRKEYEALRGKPPIDAELDALAEELS